MITELMGLDAPSARRRKIAAQGHDGAMKEELMSDIHVLAFDLAKRSFQVCGTARGGACVDAPGFARGFF